MLRDQIMTTRKLFTLDLSMKVLSLEWRFSFIVPNIEKRRNSNTQKRQCRKKQKGNSGIILVHGKQNLEHNNIQIRIYIVKLCPYLDQKILHTVSKQTTASIPHARNSKKANHNHLRISPQNPEQRCKLAVLQFKFHALREIQ